MNADQDIIRFFFLSSFSTNEDCWILLEGGLRKKVLGRKFEGIAPS